MNVPDFIWTKYFELSKDTARRVSYALLNTPLDALAPYVRIFNVDVPNCVLGAIGGLLCVRVLRSPARFVLILAVTMVLAKLWQRWDFLASRSFDVAIIKTVSITTSWIFASPWIGLGVGRMIWRSGEKQPGSCLHCGYSLTGNTSGVCPECGTAVGSKGGTPSD